MRRTVRSKDDSLTGMLMRIVYKKETYIANIILRDLRKKNQTLYNVFFFRFCMLYNVLIFCFVTTFETQNNDFSYHDQ